MIIQPRVADALQASLRLHLTAVEHYATLSVHLDRWGYAKLGEKYVKDAEEERGHAAMVLSRLEFYDVAPDLTHNAPVWPRHDFSGILTANYTLETAAAEVERANVTASRAVGDESSALVFTELLQGSEESIREIEATRLVITQVGLDNFLANQV
jgi:bacterioferritin